MKKKNSRPVEEITGYYHKAREAFEIIRHKKKDGFSLRFRFFLIVALVLAISIWLGYGVSGILRAVGIQLSDLELLLVISIVSLLAGLGFSMLASKWVFKPIKDLRVAMEQVADGDFNVRLKQPSKSQEIQEVYSGFNLMVHELGTTEMLQRDFTSNVSHEFKTPIAAIEGYSTLLQGSDNLDPDQQEYVDKILYNTKRLSGLVGNILLISKLENQTIDAHKQTYLLDEQIRESILGMESSWMAKDIEFDVDLDPIKYLGNEGLMRHVWDNLLGNAIKFSPNGGLIKIILKKQEDNIVFTIEDQGPGIPEESKKRVFDKFYQTDNSRKQDGNGLGLPLVKRILMLSGGKISIEDAEGGGSRFIVILE